MCEYRANESCNLLNAVNTGGAENNLFIFRFHTGKRHKVGKIETIARRRGKYIFLFVHTAKRRKVSKIDVLIIIAELKF